MLHFLITYFHRFHPSNIYEEARSGHVTCNMWGWICLHGTGDLTHIQGRFTAAKYVEILEDFFLPSLQERNYPLTEPILFMHDKCPIHTARVVREWFDEHPNLQLFDWPSKGCDMNPIENIWANLVNTWEPAQERRVEQLVQHAHEQWEMFRANPPLVRRHVANMSERLQAVIDNGGGWSGY